MANNIFQKNNILVRGLLNDTYNFLQRTYNQTKNVFTVASAWGQILFVLENLSQLILYFIEDSITELNIYQATRDYSIRSLARIAGYDPAKWFSLHPNLKCTNGKDTFKQRGFI